MRFAESIFKMKLIKSAMIIVLISCASVGYAGDKYTDVLSGLPDFSNCRVFQKIMRGKASDTVKTKEVEQEDTILPFGPKQNHDFDDSKYSSSTDSSLDSSAQEGAPKCVSDLYGSAESNLSMRSTQEFSPIQGRYKLEWSVESSVVFEHLRESIGLIESSGEWSKVDCMSLLELLPDLAYRFNPRKSLDVYKSMSLEELLTELKV
jgi:hypothetical protein